MSVKSGQSLTVEFITSNPTTGAAVNADSLPTAVLAVSGTDNGATVTVTNVDTGRYKAAVTLPTLTAGQVCTLIASATVSSVAGKGKIFEDTADTLYLADMAATADVADAIWDEATSGHQTAGTTGKALTSAASAGDPLATAVPGAYGAGTAGNIIGNLAAASDVADAVVAESNLVLLTKWFLNKLVPTDKGDGTTDWKLYDDNGTTVLKTWNRNNTTGARAKAV